MSTVSATDLDAQRWEVVQRGKFGACPLFVYAVRTTGVFCRPGCASRRPLRKNVIFFDDAWSAITAGYRACKRCRPDEEVIAGPHADGIRQACALIATRDQEPSLTELAQTAGLSESRFRKVFKAALGVTPKQFAQAQRRARLQAGLGQSDSVTNAIYDAGFNSPSGMYENVDALLGMSPTAYCNKGAAQWIRYATGECYLGRVLVAVTQRGVCAIELGDDDQELIEQLRQHFKAAELEHDASLANVLDQVVAYIEAPAGEMDLPLDIQGTAFQQRVWQALQTIPPGETRSYRELAEMIGEPTAVRAVASANAQNSLAIVVPCHRAIGSDGKLRGYRWGLKRKAAILTHEAEAS